MMDIYNALVAFTKWLAMWYVIGMIINFLIINLFGYGTDDSDLDKSHRSGVKVITDYKTGLQYLETSKGGITPRLNVDGKQLKANHD